ncbi:MAG: DUF559 domain-containing protein [Spirochaetes bacterium]|nr:DUF559 domain-containing protein [Spirochaetota bacterium]
MTGLAHHLRRNQTEAEKKLWRLLRSKQLGSLKIRRQQPIGTYIVDFVCFEVKLVVELDGSQHIEEKDKDSIRDDWLRSQGFIVLRFWNNDVMKNVESVIGIILKYCQKNPPPAPPI